MRLIHLVSSYECAICGGGVGRCSGCPNAQTIAAQCCRAAAARGDRLVLSRTPRRFGRRWRKRWNPGRRLADAREVWP